LANTLSSEPSGVKKLTVLIDSWAWVEYFKGSSLGKKAAHHIEGSEDAIISAINLAEVYRWFLKLYKEPQAEDARITITTRCTLVPVDEAIAVDAARIRNSERLGLGDSIVLATARHEEAKIVSGDPELRRYAEVIFIGG